LILYKKGNIKKVDKNENPTEYRSPTTYVDLVQANTLTEGDHQFGFELVFARPNRTYIEVKKKRKVKRELRKRSKSTSFISFFFHR
jgi:hypothetical protein